MKKTLIPIALALIAVAPVAFAAGSQTASLAVSATVGANCSITTLPVAFGSYDPIVTNNTTGADLAGSGSVSIACTRGASPTIGLGNGTNFSTGSRNMNSGLNLLSYALFQPPDNAVGTACPGTTPWFSSPLFAPIASPGKTARTYNVCGTVSKGQDAVVGTYSDTVVATVNF